MKVLVMKSPKPLKWVFRLLFRGGLPVPVRLEPPLALENEREKREEERRRFFRVASGGQPF